MPSFFNRNDHSAPGLELSDQGRGYLRRRCGYDDCIKRCMLLPPEITIPGFNVDVFVAELLEPSGCALGEWSDDFDARNVSAQLPQQCSLITGTSPYLKHVATRLEL